MKPALPKVIMRVRGTPIIWDGTVITFRSALTIDADGSPRAYGPHDSGLDHTANAGHPGNWWGVVTDHQGNPVIQGPHDPYPGMYVSPTTYGRPEYPSTDPRKWVNSEIVPYGVIPGPLRDLIGPVFIGCRATITNTTNGRQIEVVIAETGPSTHLGETSIAAAKGLGLPSDARTGGTENQCLEWAIFPGQPAVINGERFHLQGK